MSLHGTTPLTIGVVLTIFLIGLIFGLMFISVVSDDKKNEKIYLTVIEVRNDSTVPKIVEAGDKSVNIAPGESSRITVPSNSFLTAKTAGGTDVEKISVSNRPNTVYLTETNATTNLTANMGSFTNFSTQSVRLVEIARDGKRLEKGFLGPGGKVDLMIPSGTLWEVVDAERNNIILGSIKSGKGSRLVYDGEKLREIL